MKKIRLVEIGFLYLFVILSLFISFFIKDIYVYLSFICVLVPICYLVSLFNKYKLLHFEVSLIVFYILFFIIAPVFQLGHGYLPNTFPIDYSMVIYTNLNITLFLVCYIIFRFVLFPIKKMDLVEKKYLKYENIVMVLCTIIFITILIKYLPTLLNKIAYKDTVTFEADISETLIINKYFFSISIFLVSYYLYKVKNVKIKWSTIITMGILLSLLLIVKNPFVEKRNALGPIYLSLCFFIFERKLNVNKFFLWLTLVLIILFPLSSIFTHSHFGLEDLFNGSIELKDYLNELNYMEVFGSLHYDAWANFSATIAYTRDYGFSFGKQLLGSLLFFIPREIWEAKPVSTGALIGDYLIGNYSMWFNNLSNPFPSEGYVNFGVFGVIFHALLLAIMGRYTKKLFLKQGYYSYIAWYITIHLIFLLRGDLMNGFAYLMGVILAIAITPKIIDYFLVVFNKK
ncbi:O-antigen polymerase [Bacillus mycoides]|uniref:O-antigen polymerase n=1 Tax=Bacillus mycoides TaxID=1405 RepID=UPI00119E36C1|nr:O-antigen polymerase [Bacillus mycoides]